MASSSGQDGEGGNGSGPRLDVSALPGPPKLSDAAPPAGPAVLLDSLVGQINGRPVYASAFLEPLADRLRAKRAELSDRQRWMQEAGAIIAESLQEKIIDELLLAEAYAGLSPEMKDQGIRAFTAQLRGELVRQNQGSSALASERLQESQGLDLDAKAKEEVQKQLVKFELSKHTRQVVSISARDIRAYYERNFDRYNPPSRAQLRVIAVGKDGPAAEQVREALASGTAFDEAARGDVNQFKRETGGLIEKEVRGGDLSQVEFFASTQTALNEAARALKPGEQTGPLEVDKRLFWLRLDSVVTPAATSLYDAQLDIYFILFDQRLKEEGDRYIKRLMKRGSYSDIRTMAERLLRIAAERYYGPPA